MTTDWHEYWSLTGPMARTRMWLREASLSGAATTPGFGLQYVFGNKKKKEEDERSTCGLSKCGNIPPCCSHCTLSSTLIRIFLIASISLVYLLSHIVQLDSARCNWHIGTVHKCTGWPRGAKQGIIVSIIYCEPCIGENCTDVLVCRNRC